VRAFLKHRGWGSDNVALICDTEALIVDTGASSAERDTFDGFYRDLGPPDEELPGPNIAAAIIHVVWFILDSKGKKLGRIVHGQPATTNIAFGGSDWKTLFFTSRTTLGSVELKVPGMPVPVAWKV
jgi:hypothetical protein